METTLEGRFLEAAILRIFSTRKTNSEPLRLLHGNCAAWKKILNKRNTENLNYSTGC